MTQKNIEKYIQKNRQVISHGNSTFFEVPASEIEEMVNNLYKNHNLDLKIITAVDERQENGSFKIFYIFGSPKENIFIIPFIQLKNISEFPSISKSIHEAWNYERKIRTFFGLDPKGHPDTRSIILHENWPKNLFPLRKDFKFKESQNKNKKEDYFQKVEGEGVYEIPVGPIHAGIIEPGHFRFNVAGEEILSLEPRLGYTHKGIEKLFETLPLNEKIRLSEKVSGDSSFSHSLAFCQALESLSDKKIPESAKYLRVVFSELERMANHFGDIGAIMLDTGFNFGGANGARLREMIMQINKRYGGNRFLRGINKIGGVTKNINIENRNNLIRELEYIAKDFSEVISIAEKSGSLLNRLKDTGILKYQIAKDHGVVGIIGRAVGILKDTRKEYPYAGYDNINFEIAHETSGDVYARFYVRIKEIYSSLAIIKEALGKIPEEKEISSLENSPFKKNTISISITEGWRGDIVYFVKTDSLGNITRVDIRDPSFLHWPTIEHAGPGNIVPDFPLINKSFSLSYSGNDL